MDVATGNPIWRHTTSGSIWALAFSPEGSVLFSGAGAPDGETPPEEAFPIIMWDAETGVVLREFVGHEGTVSDLEVLPNGTGFVSAGGQAERAQLLLWDLVSGTIVEVFRGHSFQVLAIAVSPDGKYLLSASSDSTVRLWDVASSRILHTFTGHVWGISGVGISMSQLIAVSGSWDGTVRLWDLSRFLNPAYPRATESPQTPFSTPFATATPG